MYVRTKQIIQKIQIDKSLCRPTYFNIYIYFVFLKAIFYSSIIFYYLFTCVFYSIIPLLKKENVHTFFKLRLFF